LYGVFSSTGTQGTSDQDFRKYATKGWFTSYGQGGGGKISVIAKIDPSNGNVLSATFVSAVLSSGNSNSVRGALTVQLVVYFDPIIILYFFYF
jgi:hypothetical protein